MTKAIMAAILSIALVSGYAAILQPAFAHAHTTLAVPDGPAAGHEIQLVLGHTSEPTFGAKPGVHDGKHNMEVRISDAATSLPVSGASLKADKYYFKDIRSFNRASSAERADEVVKGVTVGGVFGEPGHYVARQVQKEGIYGYRVYGTINYFGEGTVPIDSTIFCKSADGDTTKFNSPGWTGSFGCTEDVNDILFPKRNSDVTRIGTESGSAIQQVAVGTDVPQTGSKASGPAYGLLIGLPLAAAAGVFGWRSLKRKGDGQ